jgi:hypothetical protein
MLVKLIASELRRIASLFRNKHIEKIYMAVYGSRVAELPISVEVTTLLEQGSPTLNKSTNCGLMML